MIENNTTQNNTNIKSAIILLAAGKSTRFTGNNKLLQKLQGVSMLTHCYNGIKKSNVEQLIVVTSPENLDQVTSLSDPCPDIGLVHNNELGLGNSISVGMNCLHKDINCVIICLADMPLVVNYHIQLLLNGNISRDFNSIIRLYDVNGNIGHPILFNSYFFPELKKLSGDVGAYDITQKYNELVSKIKVDNLSVSTDIDTMTDWDDFTNQHN
jgi:CTP:molybdopterin cytidylyltransferase MocA